MLSLDQLVSVGKRKLLHGRSNAGLASANSVGVETELLSVLVEWREGVHREDASSAIWDDRLAELETRRETLAVGCLTLEGHLRFLGLQWFD